MGQTGYAPLYRGYSGRVRRVVGLSQWSMSGLAAARLDGVQYARPMDSDQPLIPDPEDPPPDDSLDDLLNDRGHTCGSGGDTRC